MPARALSATAQDLMGPGGLSHAQYYLHVNGEMMFKLSGGVDDDSDFVVHSWLVREYCLTPQRYLDMLIEAQRLGAGMSSIRRLHDKQNLSKFIPESCQILGLTEDS